MEYMDEMAEYVKSLGIEHNVTAAYSPQSNGVAERINRTLFDMVCPMLDSSGAPLELWSEALHTACYIRNRLPSRLLNGRCPHEAWTGSKPNVAHIRKFGSLVCCHIPKKSGRKKLDDKALRTYLVGYQSNGIYRVYHPETKSIRITRDLTIHETEFINARHTVKPSRLFHISDNEEAASQSEITSSPILEDSITVMPPNAPTPVPTEATNADTARPRLNYRQRRYLTWMAAKMARAYISSIWPTNYREAMNREDAKQWEQAIQAEYESIMRNNVWTLVPRPANVKVVKTCWVLRIKDNGRYKARFCAKGFTQRWGEDYDETFAPVAKYNSVRTLFALMAGRKGAKVHQMDVNTAFLYSPLAEKVYIEQPEGLEIPGKENWVCKLNRALYGLKQSPRAWFSLIAPTLVDFHFQQCEADPCIFVYTNVKGEKTYIALYVDDFLIAGENDNDIATIKDRLAGRFDMKDLGIAEKFLGMEIEYGEDGSVKLHQEQYLHNLLQRHGMQDCNSISTPLDTSVKLTKALDSDSLANSKEYASIVGGLMFAACVT